LTINILLKKLAIPRAEQDRPRLALIKIYLTHSHSHSGLHKTEEQKHHHELNPKALPRLLAPSLILSAVEWTSALPPWNAAADLCTITLLSSGTCLKEKPNCLLLNYLISMSLHLHFFFLVYNYGLVSEWQ
jgi:hypothetical protein